MAVSKLASLTVLWATIHIVIVISHSVSSTRLRLRVHILKIGLLSLDINWWSDWLDCWWKDRLKCLEVLWVGGPVLLWELDIELDEKVSEVMVAVGWHTLSTNHLDGT